MDKDIKEKLEDSAKNNMPDMWNKIESKLEVKKKRNSRNLIAVAAALAVVIAVGGVGSNIVNTHSDNNNLVGSVNYETEIVSLPDLNVDSYLVNKIKIGGDFEASQADDKRFIEYDKEADNVIYGKVTDVNSYVDFGTMIFSDITIEVIEDYKGNKDKGDTIILGDKGGELTYEEYINQSYDNRVQKLGFDNIEDKSKMFVEFTADYIPQYRVGEYVLLYAEELKGTNKTESYSQDKYGVKRPVSYDYFALKKSYVDPNTEDVYEYTIDNKNNKLVKNSIDTLNDIESFYTQQ